MRISLAEGSWYPPINLEGSEHPYLQFHPPNLVFAIHYHQNWEQSHPDATEDASQHGISNPRSFLFHNMRMSDGKMSKEESTRMKNEKLCSPVNLKTSGYH